ncbi:hypothetical protein QZH41_005979 [Actinostola sp. cb2023]|nr:hypothetical protein QZH41_005979 [Actinostola sp. cb2023]
MKEFCLTGDVKQAFLQIEVDPIDRDAQRLLWYNDLETRETAMYHFTRVMFGSVSSPFILGATLRKHVSEYIDMYPQTAQELLENTYVDDIQFGSDDKQDPYKFKHESSELLGTAGFALHKWHSNVVELEDTERVHTECADDMDTTFAKHSVGARNSETKILGVPWNKERDELSVDFTKCIDRAENQKVFDKGSLDFWYFQNNDRSAWTK